MISFSCSMPHSLRIQSSLLNTSRLKSSQKQILSKSNRLKICIKIISLKTLKHTYSSILANCSEGSTEFRTKKEKKINANFKTLHNMNCLFVCVHVCKQYVAVVSRPQLEVYNILNELVSLDVCVCVCFFFSISISNHRNKGDFYFLFISIISFQVTATTQTVEYHFSKYSMRITSESFQYTGYITEINFLLE